MSDPVIQATHRNIAEREQKVLTLRAQIRALPLKAPNRSVLHQKLEQLLTELATLRASVHYYKPTNELQASLKRQQEKVQQLSAMFQSASGADKKVKGMELRAAAKELNEMLAAGQMQRIRRGMKAPLPSGAKANPESEYDPAEFSLDQLPENGQEVLAQFEEVFGSDDSAPWYTNKIILGGVLITIGAIAYRRRTNS